MSEGHLQILIACDKFKGSLNASDVCQQIALGIRNVRKKIGIITIPMADGGEGSLDLIAKYLSVEERYADVTDPLGRPLRVKYLTDANGTAYIESALVCGLMLLEKNEQNPMNTTTFGLGLLLREVIQNGSHTIHVFVGGSATNDGGAGMMEGLGVRFYDKDGKLLSVKGGNLAQIHKIEIPENPVYEGVRFYIWCDVRIPLSGSQGSSHMFALQKGADADAIQHLEKGMQHFQQYAEKKWGQRGKHIIPGSGAGGGLAYGLMMISGRNAETGVEFFGKITNLEKNIQKADLVITGEGRLDNQSIFGKVVYGVSGLARKYEKPCVVVCGQHTLSKEEWMKAGISGVYSLEGDGISTKEAIKKVKSLLVRTGERLARDFVRP